MNNASTHKEQGFTLIELVVVIIILGVLAAVAVPKFIDMGTQARVAAVNTMAGTLTSTSENVRVLCKTDPACDWSAANQGITIGGRDAKLNYGWLDAGDNLGLNQIDAWVNVSGFTATLNGTGSTTTFSLDGSPNPATCSIAYLDAGFSGTQTPVITKMTSGC